MIRVVDVSEGDFIPAGAPSGIEVMRYVGCAVYGPLISNIVIPSTRRATSSPEICEDCGYAVASCNAQTMARLEAAKHYRDAGMASDEAEKRAAKEYPELRRAEAGEGR